MDIVENEHPSDRRWREIMQRPRADDEESLEYDIAFEYSVTLRHLKARCDQIEELDREASPPGMLHEYLNTLFKNQGVPLVGSIVLAGKVLAVAPGMLGIIQNDPELLAALRNATSPPPAAGSSAQEDEPPAEAAKGHKATDLDYRALATPDDLVSAFGSFTGMKKEWFTPSNLRAKPDLLAARLVVGKGGRGKRATPAMFCPVAVLRWLLKPKRKAGRKISEEAGWRLLESHFAHAYSKVKGEDITRRKKLLARKLP